MKKILITAVAIAALVSLGFAADYSDKPYNSNGSDNAIQDRDMQGDSQMQTNDPQGNGMQDKSMHDGKKIGKHMFSANLTGDEETPPVKTDAKGKAIFKVSKDGTKLLYKISVTDLEGANAAHIHMGKKGESGPPIASLKITPKPGKISGMISKGSITKKELMSDLKGKDVKTLIDEINAGNAYVNVHTKKNPDGEIRGQIETQ